MTPRTRRAQETNTVIPAWSPLLTQGIKTPRDLRTWELAEKGVKPGPHSRLHNEMQGAALLGARQSVAGEF